MYKQEIMYILIAETEMHVIKILIFQNILVLTNLWYFVQLYLKSISG